MHPTIPVMPSYLFSILIEAPSPFLFGTFVEAYSSLVTRIPDYVRVVRVGREFKDTHLPFSTFFAQAQLYFRCFVAELFPNFTAYLYVLLGNISVFNQALYLQNEVLPMYRDFYKQVMSTQLFAVFVDHFWNPLQRSTYSAFFQVLVPSSLSLDNS